MALSNKSAVEASAVLCQARKADGGEFLVPHDKKLRSSVCDRGDLVTPKNLSDIFIAVIGFKLDGN